MRIEEELAFRRACILETIQSLETHFLTLYTARERQCKLFYDSSGQCDSFQLGEMVKFFMRVGTLQLQGSLTPDKKTSNNAYEGDLYALLDKLRRVPEYQIDRFHTHCGIRTRLVPLLDLVQECLGLVGICAECWQEKRHEYAWSKAKKPLVWRSAEFRLRGQGCWNRHEGLRSMFMAQERLWG